MRRLIDTGGEERASRMLAREMHDLFADSPPLPHPRYRVTFDWVSPHAQAWTADLAHLEGKPAVRALEIGCFEGQSACWFLDNVLTAHGRDAFRGPRRIVVAMGEPTPLAACRPTVEPTPVAVDGGTG